MAEQASNTVIGYLVVWASDLLTQQINYVFKYRSFITTLRDENEKLERLLSDVEDSVASGEHNGREIKDTPKDLIEKSNEKKTEAETLLKENSEVQTCCWDFICDCLLRYTVAKTADSLSKEIKKFIDEIEKYSFEVFKKPKPPPLGPELALGYKNLDSREKYLKSLRDALLEENKVLIGVYGGEKAGKTMLVEKLVKDMESNGDFDHFVMMSGEGVGTKERLILQKQIAERIGFELTLETVEERKRFVNQRLITIRKVLIIVDNVEEPFDLNKIGIPDPFNNDACRIVVVSRSSKVCTSMKAQLNLEVEHLSTDELQKLYENILTVEPPELRFPCELKKDLSCTIQLTNNTKHPVAFKIKTTNSKKYSVRPRTGSVLPGSPLVVQVTTQALKEFPPDLKSEDKFLVQSFSVSSSDRKDLTPEMFEMGSGYLVKECSLSVAFVSS